MTFMYSSHCTKPTEIQGLEIDLTVSDKWSEIASHLNRQEGCLGLSSADCLLIFRGQIGLNSLCTIVYSF